MTEFTPDLATRFADIALGHVEREYPNKPDHTLERDEDARTPRQLHPIFYGSYDWHSCLHSHWLLARVLRRHPGLPVSGRIAALFDRQFTPAKVAGECAYLARPSARGFKRPYGWAWALKLATELAALPDRRWSVALTPFAGAFTRRFRDFLPIATYPVRVGTHFNTAFGLRMAADHAEASDDASLLALLRSTARRWYGADRDCPAWGEPSGDDFLSSALIEAEAMRRLLPSREFLPWFDAFLPHLAQARPANLFAPPQVSDRSDGKIAHLDGLALSRAWCFRGLAGALPAQDARRALMEQAAARHLAAALPHLDGDYMGEHWLASFAALALDEA
ncbi:DUF2891 domain-containing protein [Rhodovarius crocodyli]|uniref:DUF2891 domain-containing protein n=1 Tax=Rhodovarius crocodyli TaxID=1979269 RepID=A0A437MH06_9PROT|nr:DUF2891 domain-containing protein [Rhodovarius crocodyli]RVT96938.1 DUF2891 domain-containing protein [Rhodovarius crocodyli]